MTNLKQEEIGKALIQLVNIRYLIDDGYHNKELGDLIKVSNVLFNELNDVNKELEQVKEQKQANIEAYGLNAFSSKEDEEDE